MRRDITKEAKSLIKAYQDVFNGNSTPQQGQVVLFDLINHCKVFTCNTKDAHQSAILEGKRSIGAYLMQCTGLAPAHGEPFKPVHMQKIIQSAESAHKLKSTYTQTKPKDDEELL